MNEVGDIVIVEDVRKERLPLSTYILIIGQGINITVAVVSATIGAVVGLLLAPSPSMGTIAYGAQFAAVLFTTYPAANLMRRYGRKAGFLIGSMSLCVSGVIGYLAVVNSKFWLLILAHIFAGIYIGFANYYRFAAVDNTSEILRSKAMSLVVSGGIIASIVGPLFSIGLRDIQGFPQFSIAYASLSGLGLTSVILMLLWNSGNTSDRVTEQNVVTHNEVSTDRGAINMPVIFIAIFAAAGGYLIMNLLMIQAMLQMHHVGIQYDVSTLTIQAHVLAMFVPSLITGRLIAFFGTRKVIIIGYFMILSTIFFELLFDPFWTMATGLVILGVGWNLTYVGGGVLLSKYAPANLKFRWQGINDSVVAICATIGATAPSFLQSSIGWTGTNNISLIFVVISIVLCYYLLPRGVQS